jgi:transketolase
MGAGDFDTDNAAGKNLHFGIREHAAAATVNELSLSKLRAYGATFLIFSDYARPAIPAIGFDGTPYPIYLHLSSHTTRWATAKMGRPISR